MAARDLRELSGVYACPVRIRSRDISFCRWVEQSLVRAGFCDVQVARDFRGRHPLTEPGGRELWLLHDPGGSAWERQMRSRRRFDGQRSDARIVVVTVDPHVEQLVRAFRAGADDYLFWSPGYCLGQEAVRILEQPRRRKGSGGWRPEAVRETGLFRSLGLTAAQIDVLVEYSRDFPPLSELAARLGKQENQMRKIFSRIYSKLNGPLAIANNAQLTQALSILAALA